MTLLAEYEDDGYLPEFGTLTVRDVHGHFVDAGLLEEHGTDAQPCGTVARTGSGWLQAASGDLPCLVGLRAYDGPPVADGALDQDGVPQWADLVELPYRSDSGSISLTTVTGFAVEEHVHLGEPGLYRVRVTHRELRQSGAGTELEAEEAAAARLSSLWQLDFWPVGELEPPRWFRRHQPAVPTGDPGWGYLLGYATAGIVVDLGYVGQGDEGTSLEELSRWATEHSWGENWLDQPLTADDHGFALMTVAEAAEQLGRPEPTTRRMLPPLFTALGCLTFDGNRYRQAPAPPLPQQVLQLSAEVLAKLEVYQSMSKYTSFTSDLMTLALWGGAKQTTIATLAERTLAEEDDVRGALGDGVLRELLRITGDLAGEFTVTVLPARSY
ncbi:DUF6042 family protein [Kribbella sp. NPDC056861]|uniref:DUF6042 family protein n=1 Tax=Kribbella sp. NPDC056861 TaxID=3154857 RepID=UPI00341742D9